jgi:hypothetical protein
VNLLIVVEAVSGRLSSHRQHAYKTVPTLAYDAFPEEHWRRVRTTDEIPRRPLVREKHEYSCQYGG